MMLTLTRIRLLNWACYLGETVLDLESKPYAITAVKDGDPDASNWSGKTKLLEAVDFALTGRRPRDARLKPDWITRGEGQGEVDLTLSDGSRVVRNMSRKGSERLAYYPPGDPEHAALQESAQQKIDELLGLSRDDAPTWSFRQGEMAELLRMDPGPRLEMFSAWLRLGKLEDCQAMAAAARGELAKRQAEAQGRLTAILYTIGVAAERAKREFGAAGDNLDGGIAMLEIMVQRAKDVLDAERAWEAAGRERRELTDQAARYDQVVEDGKQLAEKLRAMVPRDSLLTTRAKLSAEETAAVQHEAQVRGRYLTLAQVAAGNFDGKCPIVGIECPARAFVTESVGRNRDQRDRAKALVDDALRARQVAETQRGEVEREIQAADQLEGRLRVLRVQARELKPARDRWEGLGVHSDERQTLQEAETAHREAVGRLESLRAILALVRDAQAKGEGAQRELDQLEKAAQIPSAAALIFERARKKIAEDVLAEIEGHANDLLGLVGSDLGVEIRWGREGDGLADTCGGCGAAFPTSRKVKVCGRCGAERGPKVIEKLEILPSQRSGYADDFGGLAVAFGTSRWLRGDRGSQWGVALLDEPTAAADATNRRAFASKLPELLRASGMVQALVVSHHRDTLAALPGRIEVVSTGGKSTARVV